MQNHQRDQEMDPADSTRRSSNGTSSNATKTLKRGDACLACRKRRIRCGGEKPACATCERLHKECVYESIQSSSRIAKLKGRIAELENKVADLSETGGSVGNTPAMDDLDGLETSFDFSGVVPGPSTFGTGFQLSSGVGVGSQIGPDVGMDRVSTFDQTTIHLQDTQSVSGSFPSTINADPTYLNPFTPSTSYSQTYNPRPLQPPDPNFSYDFGLLDTTMMDLSSSLNMASGLGDMFASTSTSYQASSHPASAPPPADPFETVGVGANLEAFSTRSSVDAAAIASNSSSNTSLNRQAGCLATPGDKRVALRAEASMRAWHDDTWRFLDVDIVTTPEPTPSQSTPPDTIPRDQGLLGGWFDPDDVPPSVRDHLLDLYFGKKDVFHLMINVPRFYTRLTLPPAKRPHPALLYTLYLIATKRSSQPALRALETRFYEIARVKIDQGVREADRLIDIVRAITTMTGYLFSKEWYNVGYSMAGQAIRLAMACGLHRIPSSVWKSPRVFNPVIHFTLRAGGFALDPPEDAIDLGERINVFWAVYEVDQCTAIAYCWEPIFHPSKVLTPLPRPLEDYVNGMVSAVDDVRLSMIFDSNQNFARPVYTDFLPQRMKAITIFAEAMRLRYLPPEQGAHNGLHPSPNYLKQIETGCRSNLENAPCAFERVKSALDRFCEELPVGFRPPWAKWDEGEIDGTIVRIRTRREISVLWFIIANAYMCTWNIESLSAENTKAILVARRMASIIGLHVGEQMLSGYDAFIITMWNECAMILLREIKRREAFDLPRDSGLEEDFDVVYMALRGWIRSPEADTFEGNDIAAINAKMMDQLRATPRDEWFKAMQDDQKRF